MKVSEKGAVSVYGMGRFPVTLYKEQWLKLLDMSDEIRAFTPAQVKRIRGVLADRGVSGLRDLALFSVAIDTMLKAPQLSASMPSKSIPTDQQSPPVSVGIGLQKGNLRGVSWSWSLDRSRLPAHTH
jgi:hypothetical protein